jgi:hypothetical protein
MFRFAPWLLLVLALPGTALAQAFIKPLEFGEARGVFRAEHPYGTGTELVEVAALPEISTATGGDISSNGSFIVIRNAFSAHVWKRPPGTNLWDAFASPSCIITGIDEHQGEAVAFDGDSGSFYTTTEQSHMLPMEPIPIHFFQRNFSPN